MDDFDEFSLITKLIREELVHILESILGSKELIVETCLMRPLDRLASMSLLKQHNCLRVQQLRMDRAVCWDTELDHRVFLCRPTIQMAQKVCELINAQPQENYSIVLVDRRRNIFEAELEKNGIFGNVHFYEFNLALVSTFFKKPFFEGWGIFTFIVWRAVMPHKFFVVHLNFILKILNNYCI